MKRFWSIFPAAAVLSMFFVYAAAPAAAGDIVIRDARAELPRVSGRPGVAYMDIENKGAADDELLSVTVEGAVRAEIHAMTMNGAVMEMRKLSQLPVKAGATARLGKGGLHLMLFGVGKGVKAGDAGRIELTFRNAGKIAAPLAWAAP